MGLFDFIKDLKQDGQKLFNNLTQTLPNTQMGIMALNTNTPTLPGLQLSNDGTSLNQLEIPALNYGTGDKLTDRMKNGIKNFNLGDALLGKAANPTDNIGELDEDTISASVSSNPRVGGLFNDITAGARENFNNRFQADNLTDKVGTDGRNKGFAYRLGEGLGTIGRIMESPLGRGLLTAGIVGMTGGDGLQALAYGGQAGVLNQQLRNQDKMYRNEMIANAQNSLRNSPEFNTLSQSEQESIYKEILGDRDYEKLSDVDKQAFESALKQALNNRLYENQQAQLANIENNVNGLRGYVTGDTYNNFIKAQQLRDNADYRNMMANLQMQNNQALQDFRKDQAIYQQQKDAADRADRAATRALTARGQDLNYGLGMARLAADANKETPEERKAKQNYNQGMKTVNVINQAIDAVNKSPGSFGLQKGLLPPDLTNRLDPNGVAFRSIVEGVAAEYTKYLTGVQASDAERKRYERFIPNPRDNSRILNDKLKGMLNVISAREGINFNNMPVQVGKYTVRVK